MKHLLNTNTTNGGGKVVFSEVWMKVTDVNDNTPVIDDEIISISKNKAHQSDVVTTFVATDPDSGKN